MWATSAGSLSDPTHFLAFYRLLEAPEFVLLLHSIFAFAAIFFIYCRDDVMGKRVLLTLFHAPGRWCATDALL